MDTLSGEREKTSGFTLIELLIVVAMIGILAALFIPNALMAIQKARVRGTQDNIASISTAIGVYMVDTGRTPDWDGSDYTYSSSIYIELVPYHVRGIPTEDEWGHGFTIHSGASWSSAWLGMTPAEGANDEFAVSSPGRNEEYAFDYSASGAFFYRLDSWDDFNKDLVIWNGNWVCVPRTFNSGS